MQRIMRAKILFILLLSVAAGRMTCAAEPSDSTKTETSRKNIISRIIEYFSESNRSYPTKKFDFSIIGGPHYSSDSKFGIGILGAGLYRSSANDTLTPVSQVSIYTDLTTAAHFKVGICGTHIFPGDAKRLTYDVSLSSISTRFWGIGYDECRDDNNDSKYKYLNAQVRANYRMRLGRHIYIGPLAAIDYIKGGNFEKPWLWHGEATHTFNLGVGALVEYDSRDNLNNAFHGTYLRLEQHFSPRFLGNKYAYSSTSFHASHYSPLWKGAILATTADCRFTYGNTPWGLLSTFGGSSSMRGYFEGRFRDKSVITACAELRQHVLGRSGVAIWGGAGTVFSRFSQINSRRILPNYGLGYRWEFKQRVNVRLDLGFGRGTTGFIFSINEAF